MVVDTRVNIWGIGIYRYNACIISGIVSAGGY